MESLVQFWHLLYILATDSKLNRVYSCEDPTSNSNQSFLYWHDNHVDLLVKVGRFTSDFEEILQSIPSFSSMLVEYKDYLLRDSQTPSPLDPDDTNEDKLTSDPRKSDEEIETDLHFENPIRHSDYGSLSKQFNYITQTETISPRKRKPVDLSTNFLEQFSITNSNLFMPNTREFPKTKKKKTLSMPDVDGDESSPNH